MTAPVVQQSSASASAGRPTFAVVTPGVQTTVQDVGGRAGLWGVGVPPSGAWDDLSAALATLAVGNAPTDGLLEAVLRGPVLDVLADATVCVAGAASAATLDGGAVPLGVPVQVRAGQTLDLGAFRGPGLRGYLAVRGGLDVPVALGSRATFVLGGFGGLEGRALRAGDVLTVVPRPDGGGVAVSDALPALTDSWDVHVVPGPHGAPEHLTEAGVAALFATEWRLDHRSDRTGVRLVGPAPAWARRDGGDAGMHPSNIHDSAYPVGGIMLSGNTPVVVGPDGPSLGGFVVPAVVVRADRWKLAQARPGDAVRLRPVSPEQAEALGREREALLAAATAGRVPVQRPVVLAGPVRRPDALLTVAADERRPALVARRSGDGHVLVELGEAQLDLGVRLQVHLLAQALERRAVVGVRDMVEGVRSLLVGVDADVVPLPVLAAAVAEEWGRLPDVRDVELHTREVTLPIAFDDPTVHEAMQRYAKSVRPDAPWCPDNVEFIRRVNGLEARDEVFDVVTRASYLVIGLGDVYLGAPVAVPLDPADRLVTTKYDPARTWTPQNAVGIGGVYLCVYGMEGPGGYQLVGRTVPVWRYAGDADETPWLLRLFDRLRFRPVDADELVRWRADVAAGRRGLDVRATTLTYDDVCAPADTPAAQAFTALRTAAFAAELARWQASD